MELAKNNLMTEKDKSPISITGSYKIMLFLNSMDGGLGRSHIENLEGKMIFLQKKGGGKEDIGRPKQDIRDLQCY